MRQKLHHALEPPPELPPLEPDELEDDDDDDDECDEYDLPLYELEELPLPEGFGENRYEKNPWPLPSTQYVKKLIPKKIAKTPRISTITITRPPSLRLAGVELVEGAL